MSSPITMLCTENTVKATWGCRQATDLWAQLTDHLLLTERSSSTTACKTRKTAVSLQGGSDHQSGRKHHGRGAGVTSSFQVHTVRVVRHRKHSTEMQLRLRGKCTGVCAMPYCKRKGVWRAKIHVAGKDAFCCPTDWQFSWEALRYVRPYAALRFPRDFCFQTKSCANIANKFAPPASP